MQIIKAVLLLCGATFMAVSALAQFGFSPEQMFRRAVDVHPGALSIMGPGKLLKDPLNALSLGIALMFGTAGFPHILMRFFTVPEREGGAQVGVRRDGLYRLLLPADVRHRFLGDCVPRAASRVLQGQR